MNPTFYLGDESLSAEQLVALASRAKPNVAVSGKAWSRLDEYRARVDQALASGKKIYGITTGFGFLSDITIEPSKRRELQLNLIRSHACGVGPAVAPEVVRALLVLKAHGFLLGYSAVRRSCVETILAFLAHDVLPVIPCQGSVGASGDLAPLAHLALGLIGEGEVHYKGEIAPAAEVCRAIGIKPLEPEAKEGLALINGTQFMTSLGAFALMEGRRLANTADAAAALSLDAVRGTAVAYDARIHEARHQVGQRLVAANLRRLLSGDDAIMRSHADCAKVQDPYSFRCVPQVHGAVRDVLAYVASILDRELNSVTDNPLVFEDGAVLSGGNFHGQPVAFAMDFLAIAVAELGSISERRTEKMTNPHMSGLPAFVTREGGLNSGFMIPHVAVAALAAENKVLCHPASVDSIPTSADKEDHVSMGPIAARKARSINENVANILAIELLTAAQGVDLLAPLKPAPALSAVYEGVRTLSPALDQDRSLHKDIQRVSRWILADGVSAALETVGVSLN